MGETIPLKIAKRIAQQCLYSGCHERAAEDCDYCAPHDAHERGRDAAKKRRRRLRRAKSGLCSACGERKVGKRRIGRRWIVPRECGPCAKRHRERIAEIRENACVPDSDCAVPGAPVGNWRPDYDPDTGAEWQRYRGKGRRGRLTWSEQLDEVKRDILFVRDKAMDCARSIELLKTPDVQELPPLQRDAVYREVADLAAQASRLADSVEEALRKGR